MNSVDAIVDEAPSIFTICEGSRRHEWYDVPETPFTVRIGDGFTVFKTSGARIEIYRDDVFDVETTESIRDEFYGKDCNPKSVRQIGHRLRARVM